MSLPYLYTFYNEIGIDLTRNSDLIGLLPTVVIIISAIIYYFGLRWGETHVAEYNVASHYFAGILFVINYMIEPYLILLFLKYIFEKYTSYSVFIEKYTSLNIICMILICMLLIFEFILLLLFQYGIYYFRDRRKSLDNFVECEKVNPINRLVNPLKWLINLSMNFILSRLFPLMIIFIMYSLCKLNNSFEIALLSFILAFLTFTNFTFCIGYYDTHYWKSSLYLKNGKIINGIILKQGSFINILTEDGTCSINKDDISAIKVSKISKELCCDYFKLYIKN